MRKSPLCLCCVALTLGAGVVAADPARTRPHRMSPAELVEHPQVWRAFRPLAIAVGDGDAERAIRYLQASSAIIRKAEGQLDMDAATESFQDAATESLSDFDLESFHELLPQRVGRFRRFAFAGHAEADRYVVQQAFDVAAEVNHRGTRRRFGDSSGVVRMREIAAEGRRDDGRYLLQWRGGVAVGELSWQGVLGGLSDALALLDEGYASDRPLVLQAADAYLRKSQPELDEEDRRVLALAWGSYPHVAEHLLSISRTSDVLASKPVQGCTKLQSRASWRPDRIAREYPELGDFLERLDDLAKIRLRLYDAGGRQLVEWRAETERLQSQLNAFVDDGALVPSRGGRPLPSQKARYERMTARVDLHFVLRGMHLYIDDLVFDLRYRERPGGATLSGASTRVPKIRVEGAAFGMIPARVVDWFIPGDIQGLAERFYRTLAEGNEGRGLAFVARFHQDAQGRATLDGTAGAEVLDNDLVRFGISFASGRTVPGEDVEAEMRALSLAYRDAFDADVKRFAQYGRPVVAAQWAEMGSP